MAKSKKQDWEIIDTPYGQWEYPGSVTRIPSNEITMQGVPYPVLGISNTGDMQYMEPGGKYSYDGSYVTEYPLPEAGGGYRVIRSNERKGKTHKVIGPGGKVKFFGDSKLGQHPKDPARKKAFYARHKKNLAKNPYFRAFARKTWAEGGEVTKNGIPIARDGKKVLSNEEKRKILNTRGILPEQEFQRNALQEKLANNLYPVGYNYPNFINALFEKNKGRQEFEKKANNPFPYISNLIPKSRLDAFNFYMGKPQKYNTFDISDYRPSNEKDPNATYYKLNYFQNSFAPDSSVTDLEDLFKYKSLAEHDFPFLFSNKEKSKVHAADAHVMGNYTLSKGEDEKGKYYSYYDKWDISPMDFGKPFEIYDRIYYDSETNKIIPPKKPYIEKAPLPGQSVQTMGYAQGGMLPDLAAMVFGSLPKAQTSINPGLLNKTKEYSDYQEYLKAKQAYDDSSAYYNYYKLQKQNEFENKPDFFENFMSLADKIIWEPINYLSGAIEPEKRKQEEKMWSDWNKNSFDFFRELDIARAKGDVNLAKQIIHKYGYDNTPKRKELFEKGFTKPLKQERLENIKELWNNDSFDKTPYKNFEDFKQKQENLWNYGDMLIAANPNFRWSNPVNSPDLIHKNIEPTGQWRGLAYNNSMMIPPSVEPVYVKTDEPKAPQKVKTVPKPTNTSKSISKPKPEVTSSPDTLELFKYSRIVDGKRVPITKEEYDKVSAGATKTGSGKVNPQGKVLKVVEKKAFGGNLILEKYQGGGSVWEIIE